MMNSPHNFRAHPPGAEPVLSAAWVATLAQSLQAPADVQLSVPAAQAIKQRLMQRIAAEPTPPPATQGAAAQLAQPNASLVSIKRGDAWVNLGKKIQVKVLHDDGTTLSWLLRLLPGGRLPEHDHADGAEECMVLEGSLRINGEEFVCGDYQIAYPGSVHFEVSSEQGSLVFLKSPSSRRKSLIPA
jgi:anti-sigma factor ChrR (cupin superfamily)